MHMRANYFCKKVTQTSRGIDVSVYVEPAETEDLSWEQ